MRSPSNAGLNATGIGTEAILIFRPRTSMALVTRSRFGMLETTCSYVHTPVGRICGMPVLAMTGNPKLMAPAAVAYHSSVTSPMARTNAKTRLLL